MKNSILTGCAILLIHFSSAQQIDQILTIAGDTIECRIDSLTDTYLYFSAKLGANWIGSRIDITQVAKVISENPEFAVKSDKPVMVPSIKDDRPISPVSAYIGGGLSLDLVHVGFGVDLTKSHMLSASIGWFGLVSKSIEHRWMFGEMLDNRKRLYTREVVTFGELFEGPILSFGFGFNSPTKKPNTGWSMDIVPLGYVINQSRYGDNYFVPMLSFRFQYYAYFFKNSAQKP